MMRIYKAVLIGGWLLGTLPPVYAANPFAGIPPLQEQDMDAITDVPTIFRQGRASLADVLDWRAALLPEPENAWLRKDLLTELPGSEGRILLALVEAAQNSAYLVFRKTPAG